MPGLNRLHLIGHVGQSAEMRYSPQGTAVTKFTMAVNDGRKEEPEWFSCTMFGERAEKVSQYIEKGKLLYCEGRVQTNKWTDDQGQKHQRQEVIVNDVQFLDRRQQGGDDW